MGIHALRYILFMHLSERANFAARALFVAPKFKKLINLFDRKAESAGALYERSSWTFRSSKIL